MGPLNVALLAHSLFHIMRMLPQVDTLLLGSPTKHVKGQTTLMKR